MAAHACKGRNFNENYKNTDINIYRNGYVYGNSRSIPYGS